MAVVATLGSMRVPILPTPSPPLASPVRALVALISPVWSLIRWCFERQGPLWCHECGTPDVGRASVGNSCPDSVTGDGRDGLVDGDAGIGSCGVANCGGVSIDLADGGRNGGWACPVSGGCLGRGSDTSGRADGGVASTSCGGCDVG